MAVIPRIRVSCAAAFRSHHWRLWNTGSPAVAHPEKPHEENIFGKSGIFTPKQRSFYQASLDAALRSLPVRRLTSTIRPPILAPCQRHNEVQGENSSGIGRCCRVGVIGMCSAADGRAFPIAFSLHQVGRENLGTDQDLLL
jgi:hypothetical protein